MRQGETLLIKLPYPYGKPQIYLPTDLLIVGSRLEQAGISVTLLDLNLQHLPPLSELAQYSHVGIGVFGAPYVPGARATLDYLRQSKCRLYVGGQVIEHLSVAACELIFGNDVTAVIEDADLERLYELESGALRSPFECSILPVFSKLSADAQRAYLSHEFSFFVSQGCKFRCDFCAAHKQEREHYRTFEAIRSDLILLSSTAIHREITELSLYLSPLDLFQSPLRLAAVLGEFSAVQKQLPVLYKLRGLSRADSFVHAVEENPKLRQLMEEAGLEVIGFGVDGTSERVWREQHKGQISLSLMDQALGFCRELKITPELLMVMGFPQDTLRSLTKNLFYSLSRMLSHGAVSRPYLAKCFVPGNIGWQDARYQNQRAQLTDDPNLFLNLDFAAFASRLTHPRRLQRWLSNLFYGLLVGVTELFHKNATYPLMPRLPVTETTWGLRNNCAAYFNRIVPFDR